MQKRLIYWQKHQTLFVIYKKISRKLYYKDVNADPETLSSGLLAHNDACAPKFPPVCWMNFCGFTKKKKKRALINRANGTHHRNCKGWVWTYKPWVKEAQLFPRLARTAFWCIPLVKCGSGTTFLQLKHFCYVQFNYNIADRATQSTSVHVSLITLLVRAIAHYKKDWEPRERVGACVIMGSFGGGRGQAHFFFFFLTPASQNDPITESGCSFAPGFHSFEKWAIQDVDFWYYELLMRIIIIFFLKG